MENLSFFLKIQSEIKPKKMKTSTGWITFPVWKSQKVLWELTEILFLLYWTAGGWLQEEKRKIKWSQYKVKTVISVNDNIQYIIISPMAIQEHAGCYILKVAPPTQHVTSAILWILHIAVECACFVARSVGTVIPCIEIPLESILSGIWAHCGNF